MSQMSYDDPKPLPDVPENAEKLGYLQFEFMLDVANKMGISGTDNMTFREIDEAIRQKDSKKHGMMVRRNDVLERMYFEFKRLRIMKAEYDSTENAILYALDGQKEFLELNIFGIEE